MIKVWENGRMVLNYDDFENEKLVRQTLSNLKQGAANEEIESVARAIDTLSEFPLAHVVVTQSDRLIV